MASSGCKFDLSTFRAGLRAKLKVTKKAEADILNRAGGSVVANAIRLTPRADPAKIEAELTTGGLAFRLLQSPRFQSRLPKKLQGFTKGTHTRAQLNAAAKQLVALRRRSANYIRAGWYPALRTFRPGVAGKVSEKGLASQGKATKATESRLVATFENHARGAGDVGAAALQQALDNEGRSMQSYAEQKLAAAWR